MIVLPWQTLCFQGVFWVILESKVKVSYNITFDKRQYNVEKSMSFVKSWIWDPTFLDFLLTFENPFNHFLTSKNHILGLLNFIILPYFSSDLYFGPLKLPSSNQKHDKTR